MSENKLQQCDCIIGGSKSDYQNIAKIANVDIGLFTESSLIRGGCFWSERKNIPIPGVIKGSRIIEKNIFIDLLNIHYSNVRKNHGNRS